MKWKTTLPRSSQQQSVHGAFLTSGAGCVPTVRPCLGHRSSPALCRAVLARKRSRRHRSRVSSVASAAQQQWSASQWRSSGFSQSAIRPGVCSLSGSVGSMFSTQRESRRGSCPLRARQSGRSRSRTVVNGDNTRKMQVSGSAGQRRSVVPTSQAGSAGSIPVTPSVPARGATPGTPDVGGPPPTPPAGWGRRVASGSFGVALFRLS
jgi:hypothetical protein